MSWPWQTHQVPQGEVLHTAFTPPRGAGEQFLAHLCRVKFWGFFFFFFLMLVGLAIDFLMIQHLWSHLCVKIIIQKETMDMACVPDIPATKGGKKKLNR